MLEVSGVVLKETPVLNTGDTAVLGVVDADCAVRARCLVTGMADGTGRARLRVGGKDAELVGQVSAGNAGRRDKTRLNLIYGRVFKAPAFFSRNRPRHVTQHSPF